MNKPVVYIAGPYSDPDPVANTHEAIKIANSIEDVCTPFIPHLTLLWHLITPKPYPKWLALDMAYLARFDALYRFGGASGGADKEVDFAREHGIRVFLYNIEALRSWCEVWRDMPPWRIV